MTMVMNRLKADGRLRDDLTAEKAAEIAWALMSPHHFELLVMDRGWSVQEYREHLERVIMGAILKPAAPSHKKPIGARPASARRATKRTKEEQR